MLVKNRSGKSCICNECIALCEEIILDHIRDKKLGEKDSFHLDEQLVAMVPKEIALRYKVVPVWFENNFLAVAGVDSERKHEIIKLLKVGRKYLKVGFLLYPYESVVLNTLKKYYGFPKSKKNVIKK